MILHIFLIPSLYFQCEFERKVKYEKINKKNTSIWNEMETYNPEMFNATWEITVLIELAHTVFWCSHKDVSDGCSSFWSPRQISHIPWDQPHKWESFSKRIFKISRKRPIVLTMCNPWMTCSSCFPSSCFSSPPSFSSFIINFFHPSFFLVADTRLYTLPCRSVGRLVLKKFWKMKNWGFVIKLM